MNKFIFVILIAVIVPLSSCRSELDEKIDDEIYFFQDEIRTSEVPFSDDQIYFDSGGGDCTIRANRWVFAVETYDLYIFAEDGSHPIAYGQRDSETSCLEFNRLCVHTFRDLVHISALPSNVKKCWFVTFSDDSGHTRRIRIKQNG